MNFDALLPVLRELEVALHHPNVRRDRQRLDELLHPEFLEFGRSGRTYTKADVLINLPSEQPVYVIWAQDFSLQLALNEIALLTYKSAHVAEDGELERHTVRASLWKLMPTGWQMLFHQGTPTEPFEQNAT
jgi:hypothetical protein